MNFGENFQSLEVFENESFDPPDPSSPSGPNSSGPDRPDRPGTLDGGCSIGMTTFGENLTDNVHDSLRFRSLEVI